MLTPDRLLRLVIEVIFILLGGLIGWLGFAGYLAFDRRAHAWLFLSLGVLLWGGRLLFHRGKRAAWEGRVTGGSFLALGLVMLAAIRVPFAWVPRLFVAAGAILVLRGLVAALLLLRRG